MNRHGVPILPIVLVVAMYVTLRVTGVPSSHLTTLILAVALIFSVNATATAQEALRRERRRREKS